MKTVILAGGFGTRISEESHLRPKPMIEIGDRPILWHIMKIYSHYGYNEFIICLGYKGHMIKEFFADYYMHMSDVTFDFSDNNSMKIHNNIAEPWKVTLVDTGLNTMTGGRLKRIKKYLDDEDFMMTYGDGVADIDLNELLRCHKKNKTLVTVSAVQVGGRFGVLEIDNTSHKVTRFSEKAKEDGGHINGGFMVLNPKVLDFIQGDDTFFEREPMEKLASIGELGVYKHDGFWQCMDTQRDKGTLEKDWQEGTAKWKLW